MQDFIVGPRRISPRRLLCIPDAVLRRVGLTAPSRVVFRVGAGGVLIQSAGENGTGGSVSLSSVRQLIVPQVAIDALALGPDRLVYARVASGAAVELLAASRIMVSAAGGHIS